MAVNSVDYTKTLTGQLLVATPQMTDPRFQKRALFICQHDETAAMGFIINQPSEEVTISSLSDQLEIDQPRFEPNAPVYIGVHRPQTAGNLGYHINMHGQANIVTNQH